MKTPYFAVFTVISCLACLQAGYAQTPQLHLTDAKPVATFESTAAATAATVSPHQAPTAVGVQFDLVAPALSLQALSVQLQQPVAKLITQSAPLVPGRWRIAAYMVDSLPLPTDLAWQLVFSLGTASPPEGPVVVMENILFTTSGGNAISPSAASYGSLGAWKLSQFSATDLANALYTADDADPDGDGLTNLAEFVTGTTALTPEPEKAPVAAPNLPGQIALRFSTARDSRALLAIPQTSTNLKTWTSQGVSITFTGNQDANSLEKQAAVTTDQTRKYLRVQFLRP